MTIWAHHQCLSLKTLKSNVGIESLKGTFFANKYFFQFAVFQGVVLKTCEALYVCIWQRAIAIRVGVVVC